MRTESPWRSLFPVFALLVVSPLLCSTAFGEFGGEDVRIFDSPAGTYQFALKPEIAVSRSGDVFVAVDWTVPGDSNGPHEVHVYKSTNGGGDWSRWGVIRSGRAPALAIGAAPDRDVIAVAYQKSAGEVRISTADPSDEVPSWHTVVIPAFVVGAQEQRPKLAVREMPGSPPHIYALLVTGREDMNLQLYVSQDGGASFGPQLTLNSAEVSQAYSHDIAVTPEGTVLVGWMNYETRTRIARVWARRGFDGATDLRMWKPKTFLGFSDHDSFWGWVSVAVAPGGSEALLAADIRSRLGERYTSLYTASREGSEPFDWSPTPVKFSSITHARVHWGPNGPAMIGEGSGGALLLRPSGAVTGQWDGEIVISGDANSTSLTHDDTRGGRLAVVASLRGPSFVHEAWFDAEWRSGPLRALMDIQPGTCTNPLSLRKQGVIPVVLLGTGDFDVNQVDVSTLLLEGVAPQSGGQDHEDMAAVGGLEACDCAGPGPDGFPDMPLKFRAGPVIEALGGVSPGDRASLTLTGNLMDGSSFEATDCVEIKGPGGRVLEPLSGDGAPRLDLSVSPDSRGIQRIHYAVPEESHVRLTVFDVSGRPVDRLVNSIESPGSRVVEWHAGASPSGVYFVRLQAGLQIKTVKMLLVH